MVKFKNIFLFLTLCLSGCSFWAPDPLKDDQPVRTVVLLSPQSSHKQMQFIDDMFSYYNIARCSDLKDADLKIILSPVIHDSIDYFIEQTQKSLFKNYRSTLHVQVLRNDTHELLMEKTFVSLETLKDDVSFYKEQELALVHLQWRQQRNLFDQCGSFVEKLCHGTIAGL